LAKAQNVAVEVPLLRSPPAGQPHDEGDGDPQADLISQASACTQALAWT
jgi:hypothetical protein